MPGWRRPSFQLLAQLLIRLAHVRVSHVHLPVEVIRQPAIIVESTQIGTANVADLQLLVARRAGRVSKVFELALAGLFLVFGCADLEQLVISLGDAAHLAQDRDLEQARVNRLGELRDLFQLVARGQG